MFQLIQIQKGTELIEAYVDNWCLDARLREEQVGGFMASFADVS